MFVLRMRLRVQRTHMERLRVALGDMRQRTQDADPRVRAMQEGVWEVEQTLRRCELLAL